MNDIYPWIIKYELNNFLNLQEKINLSQVNKKFNSIQKDTIFLHIGEILSRKIGIEDQSDYKIINQFRFDTMKEIVKYIFDREQEKIIKTCQKNITIGNLLKIKSNNLNNCKKLLLNNKLKNNKNYSSLYNTPAIFKKNFYLTYALI